jgi:hypothetical protein
MAYLLKIFSKQTPDFQYAFALKLLSFFRLLSLFEI